MHGSSIHEMVTVIGLTYGVIHTSCMHADLEANPPLYAEIPYSVISADVSQTFRCYVCAIHNIYM